MWRWGARGLGSFSRSRSGFVVLTETHAHLSSHITDLQEGKIGERQESMWFHREQAQAHQSLSFWERCLGGIKQPHRRRSIYFEQILPGSLLMSCGQSGKLPAVRVPQGLCSRLSPLLCE